MDAMAIEILTAARAVAAKMERMSPERRAFYGFNGISSVTPAKVFVAQVWAEGFSSRMTLETFKLECYRLRGELNLSRCDLVQAFERVAVATSEIAVNGATFHFIDAETL